MDADALLAELSKPVTAMVLRESPLMRLAYVAADGTPRVVPVSFLWQHDRMVIWTVPTSAKVRALRRNPAVAVTIDRDGQPPRALLIRGVATIDIVDGVPQGYVEASLKTMSAQGSEDFGAAARAMYDSMAQIVIEPTWARMNDFETTLPKDVERIAISKGLL